MRKAVGLNRQVNLIGIKAPFKTVLMNVVVESWLITLVALFQ